MGGFCAGLLGQRDLEMVPVASLRLERKKEVPGVERPAALLPTADSHAVSLSWLKIVISLTEANRESGKC